MILKIFSIRTSLASSISSAHRGRSPQSRTANTIASNSGLYCASKGQLMKTRRSYLFSVMSWNPPLFLPPGLGQFSDRFAHLLAVERIRRIDWLQNDGSAFRFRGHRFLRDAKIFEWNLGSCYRRDQKAATFALVTTPVMVVD